MVLYKIFFLNLKELKNIFNQATRLLEIRRREANLGTLDILHKQCFRTFKNTAVF